MPLELRLGGRCSFRPQFGGLTDICLANSVISDFGGIMHTRARRVSVAVVAVIAIAIGTFGSPAIAAPTAVVASSFSLLVAATPTISGTAVVEATLTARPGVWTTGTIFTYQWYADTTAIVGATAPTLNLTSVLQGKQVSVKVTGQRTGYTTAAKVSAKTAKVLVTAAPTISGTVAVGYTLTAKPGTWTSLTSFSYQWLRNGVAISGATQSTYRVRPTDAYAVLSVKVTGSRIGYASATKASASTIPAKGKVYATCALLNADYPDGIRKSGITADKKSGVYKSFVGNPYVSTDLYNLQSIARDGDRDGIMCER